MSPSTVDCNCVPDCSRGEENSKTTGNFMPLAQTTIARWRLKRSLWILIHRRPSLSFHDVRISRVLTSKTGLAVVLNGAGDPGSLLTQLPAPAQWRREHHEHLNK